MTARETTVERHRRLDDGLADALRAAYVDAFEPARDRYATRVVLTDYEWRAAVVDDESSVKLVAAVDGAPAGLVVVTDRPELVDWLESTYLDEHFGDALAARSLWFVVTAFVTAEGADDHVFDVLLDALLELVGTGTLLFDTGTEETPRTAFSRTIEARAVAG